MTIEQIRKKVSLRTKVSRAKLYRLISDCGITPLGSRQRPQRYPDNAPLVILLHLGLAESEELTPVASGSAGNGAAAGHNATNGAVVRKSARIPTLTELRNARKKARAGK